MSIQVVIQEALAPNKVQVTMIDSDQNKFSVWGSPVPMRFFSTVEGSAGSIFLAKRHKQRIFDALHRYNGGERHIDASGKHYSFFMGFYDTMVA